MKNKLIFILLLVLSLSIYSEVCVAEFGGEGAFGSIINYLKRVTTNIIPSIDNNYDLGSSAKAWKTLYVNTISGPGALAPANADYLVGTANGTLSAEIIVGTSPGGQLGGTWASPTIDDLFLLNSTSDTMTGTLTCDGVTMGNSENLTFGSETLTFGGTDFDFSDDINITDDLPTIQFTDSDSGHDDFEVYAEESRLIFTNITHRQDAMSIETDDTITINKGLSVGGYIGGSTLTENGLNVSNSSDKLNFFSLTSSSELSGVITDETGTGLLTFSTSPTFTTQISTPKIVSSGNLTIDAVNASATSTVYILNSGGTQTADLNIEGDLIVTDIQVTPGNLLINGDLTVTGGDITLGTTSIFSGGDTASLNNIDAIDATTEATLEGALDIGGDVTSTGMASTVIAADAVHDTMIDWGSGAGQVDLADIPGGVSGANVWDFGGATSTEIVNGANSTTDAAGEIAIDSSAAPGAGIRFYGDAAYTIAGTYSKSFVILNPVATDDYPIWCTPYAITIKHVRVQCLGGTNIVGQLTECDAEGINPAVIDSSDITATANNSVDDDGTLSNPSVDALDYVGWATTSISGTPTSVTVTFDYTIDQVN